MDRYIVQFYSILPYVNGTKKLLYKNRKVYSVDKKVLEFADRRKCGYKIIKRVDDGT